jgi:CheY-like chemotaxis protein
MAQSGSILVVDDDPGALEVAVNVLTDRGYEVLQADNGATALRTLHANPSIQLLLTDIVMPGMTGWDLAHRAKQIRPELKILYTSGYVAEIPVGEHGLGYGPLLPKPWRGAQLEEQVGQLLGS